VSARCALALLLLVVAIAARGEERSPFALTAGETQTVRIFGVTAVWAVDPGIVEVAAQQGNVTLFARGIGRTTVIVVGVTGEQRYDVVVHARGGAAAPQVQARADRAAAEARYSSAAREIQTSATATHETKTARVEAAVRTVHRAGDVPGDRAKTSIAEATYRIFTRGRELTILDRDVDHSPLTLEATPLRGIHYLDEHWRLHAGYTAYATYRSFLVPVERQVVAGGGYVFRTGARSTITPSVFAIRGEGSVASLLFVYDQPERLLVRAEAGYSHGLGGAAEIAYDGRHDRVRAAFRYRPDDFAVAGTATPRGFLGNASWTHDYGRSSTAAASWSATDALGIRVVGGTADVDHRLSEVVSLTGGASWASFDGRHTLNFPAGFRLDFDHGGVSALYRYTRAFNNEGGHGFRVAGRLSLGHLYASAFADQQRNAPTLELIFSERPDLAVALAELGIVATSPADVARALREEAILRELGFVDGVTLDLAPVRTQVGFEAAWLGASRSRQQFRARVLRNVTESVAARTTTLIGTLSYSRRLTDAADVFGSWTYWRIDTAAGDARVQPFVEAGIRQRFNDVGSLFGGRGTISGAVFRDEDLDGRSDGTGIAAEVELDGTQRQRTREDGSFAFKGVPHGTHRVVARVPDHPDAYFTTASRVEAAPGDRVSFGVASTPARLLGQVIDDAGDGVGGVRLLLRRGSQQLTASSGTDGRFIFATAPGEWQLAIGADSVPAGYSREEKEARTLMLDRAEPLQVAVTLSAHRTVRGRALPYADVEVAPLDRHVRADAEGQFSIRSLSPGVVTLTSGGVVRRVEVPRGPATLNVELVPSMAATAADQVVQIGAYRVRANAVAAAAQARAAGVSVVLAPSGTLIIVRTEPRDSAEALAIAQRLLRAGVDAVVLAAK
jgi:hypothetical protein